MGKANWRRDYPILVPDAHSVAAVGVIRSLGRAGYPVHATATKPDALGFASAYAIASAVSPPYSHLEYIPWLRHYLAHHGIKGIAPAGVIFQAVRPYFHEFGRFFPVASDEVTVFTAFSKYDVSARLMSAPLSSGVKAHLPPTLLLRDDEAMPSKERFAAFSLPLFLKTDDIYSRNRLPGSVFRADTVNEALRQVDKVWEDYSRVTIQGFVPGKGAAAAFIIWNNELIAHFMNLCLHEINGFCTLRESWSHDSILRDAEAKIRYLGWEGISMLEYRWDPSSDAFHFIELNPRFWAALHVALYARSDLPRWLFDIFFGRLEEEDFDYALGIRSRLTFPFEIAYLLSRLRDNSASAASRVSALFEFFGLFVVPSVRADLYFPRDRGLYWLQARRTMMEIFSKRRN